MTTSEMKALLKSRAAKVDAFLAGCVTSAAPSRLSEAMLYSLKAGGKRLRPVLCLSFGKMAGASEEALMPFAAAIEMIHTYSLIHDDLPAMDDDDLRRGKPANHKQFDEATAILAGDALLTDAFSVIGSADLPVQALLPAMTKLANAAGSGGMAGGQMLDMQYTGATDINLDKIRQMQAMKTGALIQASCVCGALLAQAPEDLLSSAGQYGAAFGLAFQIADDILDVTATSEQLGKPGGSDIDKGKNTWPSLLGVAESKKIALAEAEKAKACLPDLPESEFLAALADYAVSRSA